MTQPKPQVPTVPESTEHFPNSGQMLDPPVFSPKSADEILLKARAALSDKLSLPDLASMRVRLQKAADQSRAWADHLSQRVLSPLMTRQEITTAKKQAEDAEFDAQRIAAALALVSEAEDEELEKENQADRQAHYREVVQERDMLASEITVVWPNIAKRVTELCERIMHSNARIEAVNRNGLPVDEKPLQTAEAKARGFHDANGIKVPSSLSSFRITQSLVPGLEPDKPAWPPVDNYKTRIQQAGKVFDQKTVDSMWRKKNGK